ncbi:hypothetical protein A3K78_02960 [Candidatus Bathyarchaeota archaeon RBG_13_52_12]|nr:MAG: hypothetical protein A3K78_02960 [Candidatus Bathyarchaeota archaeon RBG_13_52_12]
MVAHIKAIIRQRGLRAGLAVVRRIPFVKPTIMIRGGKVSLVPEIPSIHFEQSVETMIGRIEKDVQPLGLERVYVVDSYLPSEPVDCVRKATGLLRTFYDGPIDLRKVPAVVMVITGDVVLAVGCVTKRANPLITEG